MILTARSKILGEVVSIITAAAAGARLRPDEIDEAQQRALMALAPHAERLASMAPGERRVFVWKTATRISLRLRREQARRLDGVPWDVADEILLLPDREPSASQKMEAQRRHAAVQQALGAMETLDRVLIKLVGEDGQSERDAARALSVSRGSVAYRLRRAREALKRAWLGTTEWLRKRDEGEKE